MLWILAALLGAAHGGSDPEKATQDSRAAANIGTNRGARPHGDDGTGQRVMGCSFMVQIALGDRALVSGLGDTGTADTTTANTITANTITEMTGGVASPGQPPRPARTKRTAHTTKLASGAEPAP
jgi:hypothetical protein